MKKHLKSYSKKALMIIFILAVSPQLFGQNVIVSDQESAIADLSAMLDVYSTSKGMLVPRLTQTQMENISSPAPGLLVYNKTSDNFFFYTGSEWLAVGVTEYFLENAGNLHTREDTVHIGIGTPTPFSKLTVQGDQPTGNNEALFEVKNSEGQAIFAVYENEVRVNFKEDVTKSTKGGFAVGGLRPNKAEPTDYFRISPDTVQVFINDTYSTKGRKGGFAVGGLSPNGKGERMTYLSIGPDSTRVYVNDTSFLKGRKGGFAVGGLSPNGKGVSNLYLTIERDSTRIYMDNSVTKGRKGGFAVGGLSPNGKGDGSTYFDVNFDTTQTISPSEARILWYPSKEAFLTGKVLIESPDSVGTNSFASGFESKALGNWSQALGYKAIARGDYTTAIGREAVANDTNSFAFGEQALALGIGSYAFGSLGRDTTTFNATDVSTTASGDYSFALGLGAQATGHISMAMGNDVQASGKSSLALGASTSASGDFATAWGKETVSSSYMTTSFGYKSSASGTAATAFGQETQANNAWSTAFGYQSIASANYATAFGKNATASGLSATAFGATTIAAGDNSTAFGTGSEANGAASVAMGWNSRAENNYSLAFGYDNLANAEGAIAIGRQNIANGYRGTAIGYFSMAEGSYSTSIGQNVEAGSGYEVVVGRYNTTYTPSSATGWNSSDRLFVVGNGTGFASKSNAMVIFKNGNVSFDDNVTVGSTTSFPAKLTALGGMTSPSIPNTASTGVFRVATGSTQGIDFGKMGTGSFAAWMQVGFSGIADPLAIQPLGGNVGIGTTAPATTLHVNHPNSGGIGLSISNSSNTTYRWSLYVASSSERFRLYYQGNFRGEFDDVTGIYYSVGKHLSENYRKINPLIDKVMELEVLEYDNVDQKDDRSQFGLNARDVEKIFPQLVTPPKVSDEGESPYTMNYSGFGVIAVKAIQEQQEHIKESELRIKKLQEQVEFLIQENARLQKEFDKIKTKVTD